MICLDEIDRKYVDDMILSTKLEDMGCLTFHKIRNVYTFNLYGEDFEISHSLISKILPEKTIQELQDKCF